MTGVDMLTENGWDAEREEARADVSDLAAREELLESITVMTALANGTDSRIRVDSMRARRDGVFVTIPHDASAVAAIRSWGVDVPEARDFLGTGSRTYFFTVRRAGIDRHVSVTSYPYDIQRRGVAS